MLSKSGAYHAVVHRRRTLTVTATRLITEMRLSQIGIRVGLGVASVVSVGVIVFAFNTVGIEKAEFWAVFAGALAVLTSVISAWTGQRSLELEQDAREPYPYPTIDTESRYGLVQLHVRNTGGSAAHDINLEWDEPLLDSEGNEVIFTEQKDAPDIPVLLPGESVRVMIDGNVQFFPNVEDANYTGFVRFRDASGYHYSHKFFLSAERHRKSLYYEREELKTYRKLQDVPHELGNLTKELKRIRKLLQSDDN